MKKKTKKFQFVCVALCCAFALPMTACVGDATEWLTLKKPATLPTDYVKTEYTPAHTAENNFIHFAGSDESFAEFLNYYAEIHMRGTSNRIGLQSVGGSTRPAWKEWDSMIAGWWDASSENGSLPPLYASADHIVRWLKNPIQDNQGYVWQDQDASTQLDDWAMGWAFPSYKAAQGGGKAWGFGTSDSYTDWQLNNPENFTSNQMVNGCWEIVTKNSSKTIEIETKTATAFNQSIRKTPFLRLGFSYIGSGAQDLAVYYQTSEEATYTEDKSAKFSDFCTTGFSLADNPRGAQTVKNYFFPMYLQSKWGTSYNTKEAKYNRKITKLKFVLSAQEGKSLSGTLKYDFIASQFDDRQIINPCNYIIAAKNMLQFSRDKTLLQTVLPKARACLNFLLDAGRGDSGLISTAYMPGHFNDGEHGSLSTLKGIGDGYWDVDMFPTVSLYTNLSFYNALLGMKYLEDMAKYWNLAEYNQTTKTRNAAMNGYTEYTANTAESLSDRILRCKSRVQTEFWNEQTGRFHLGKYDNASGGVQDHGYTLFNQQAVVSGLATPEQAKSIMRWINGERIVDTDNSTGKDIYRYGIAPRFNTEDIGADFVFLYSCDWDGNVQNGGTALHLSYYDVVAQSKIGADGALTKLKSLQNWFEDVKAAGGKGNKFYREYYKNSGIPLQGNNDSSQDSGGMLGLDSEFMEAALLFKSVPDAFFGLSATADGTLCFKPDVPVALGWMRLENLLFGGWYYDVTASKYFVQISNLRAYKSGEGAQDAHLSVTFRRPDFAFAVAVNGVKTNAYYDMPDGTIRVQLPWENLRVELLPA